MAKPKPIPLPDAFLSRHSRVGKFQGHPFAGVTARQFQKGVEIFSKGSIKVMTKKETLKERGVK